MQNAKWKCKMEMQNGNAKWKCKMISKINYILPEWFLLKFIKMWLI
jgi:hypothetical protein